MTAAVSDTSTSVQINKKMLSMTVYTDAIYRELKPPQLRGSYFKKAFKTVLPQNIIFNMTQ